MSFLFRVYGLINCMDMAQSITFIPLVLGPGFEPKPVRLVSVLDCGGQCDSVTDIFTEY